MMADKYPVRILHVFGIMNCGGAETFIMNIYRNIDREKIQFDFIVHCEDKAYYDDEIKALGGRKYVVPNFSGNNYLKYKKAWRIFFETHIEYKIIHSHIRSTASIFLSIAKKKGLVTIIHSHSTSSGSGFSAYIKDILQFPLRNITDYRFACSREAGKWLFGNKRFDIIKNAIQTDDYIFNKVIRDEYRELFGITNKFVVGHIGRFYEPKNHFFIIDIFKSIHDLNLNSVLLLVGDGSLRYKIERRIEELNLHGDVIFTGVRNDIPELLQAMDVFLFPSLYEGLGIVTIEAQAAGLPCLVSESVPNEIAITELVQFLSLQKSADVWAKEALREKNPDRTNTNEKIKNSGYDVREQVAFLEGFYQEIRDENLKKIEKY